MPRKTLPAPARIAVLGALRKSRVRKRPGKPIDQLAASLELQQDQITRAFPEGTPLTWASDPDVSGAVPPLERPDLGPKMADLDSWTHLAIARFDRVSRSVGDFSDLIKWLNQRGKILVCLDPPIDLSTASGRAFANMLATFAEYERDLDSERTSDMWHALKDAGKWPGGTVPFGYLPIRAPGGSGWILAPHPEYAPIVVEMVRRYLDGFSFRQIALWMNAEGYPASRDVQRIHMAMRQALEDGTEPPPDKEIIRGKGWSTSTVRKVLMSPTLAGYVLAEGDLRRGQDDNMPVRIEPLIGPEEYQRLQVALSQRANSPRQANASMLLGIAVCFKCESPMHITTYADKGTVYRYYICDKAREGDCPTGRVPADDLEALAIEAFLLIVGDCTIKEPVYFASVDSRPELADVAEAIANLESQYAMGNVYKGPEGVARFTRMMNRLDERREELAAVGYVPARTEYRETETTFRERWDEADRQGQHYLMYESGFRLYYSRVAVSPEVYRQRIREAGVTKTATQLRRRAHSLRTMLARPCDEVRQARLQADLEAVEADRRKLREVPRYDVTVSWPIGEELAARAGLVASGQA